ncbi:MAG: DUF3108 domain-containing protein [Saprospiraceae bacterium]|nr:DUF3108 domain-containing protein [Saprospiraceae bacterium]
MKKIILSLIILIIASTAFSQQVRKIENTAFQRGEYLKYRAYYDAWVANISAGEAIMQITKEDKKISNRSTMHVEGIGRSKGAFNWFFKVYDRYETYIDEETIAPWMYVRRVNEGGYTASQDVVYNQYKKQAYFKDNRHNRSATIETPEYVHDIISAVYYARTIDYTNAKIDDEYPIQFMFDDTVYTTKIVYLGKVIIKTSLGKFRCLKFKPMVLTGNVFDDPYPMLLYVTDDKNHIPILATSKILVGTVKLELVEFSGLANPLSSKIEKK